MTKVIDVQSAYTLVCEAHRQVQSDTPIEMLPALTGNAMEIWFRRVLADTLYERNLLADEDLVLAAVYVAELLASRRGAEYRSTLRRSRALAQRLADIVENNLGAFHFLMLGERAFMMYCFFPEQVPLRTVHYTNYSREMGIRAYSTFGDIRDNEFGQRMARAFAPIGNIVREKFTSRT